MTKNEELTLIKKEVTVKNLLQMDNASNSKYVHEIFK